MLMCGKQSLQLLDFKVKIYKNHAFCRKKETIVAND